MTGGGGKKVEKKKVEKNENVNFSTNVLLVCGKHYERSFSIEEVAKLQREGGKFTNGVGLSSQIL